MNGKMPLHAETARRFGGEQYARPGADRDGVGHALRAIYDDVQQSRAIPDDFSRLLRRLG